MNYIVSKLVTDASGNSFYLLGQSKDKKNAARLAATAYRDYNQAASEQNVEMITEWLETRGEYSFRRDPKNRLRLAITPLEDESQFTDGKLVFVADGAEEEKLFRLSRALFDGKGEAVYRPSSCPATPDTSK